MASLGQNREVGKNMVGAAVAILKLQSTSVITELPDTALAKNVQSWLVTFRVARHRTYY